MLGHLRPPAGSNLPPFPLFFARLSRAVALVASVVLVVGAPDDQPREVKGRTATLQEDESRRSSQAELRPTSTTIAPANIESSENQNQKSSHVLSTGHRVFFFSSSSPPSFSFFFRTD